jgi:hypothetical protein
LYFFRHIYPKYYLINILNKEGETEGNGIWVNVLIRDLKFKVFCGMGNQSIRWLTDVAIFRYENLTGTTCGLAYGLKLENGNMCDLHETINTILKKEENVWILLKEEFDIYQEEIQKMMNL